MTKPVQIRASNTTVAMGLVLFACAFFAATNLVAKIIAVEGGDSTLHPLQLALGRFMFGTLMLSPILLWKGKAAVRSAVPAYYLIRSGCSVGAVSCIFAAVAALPLADVTALNYASPFFTLILARLILREHVDAARWIAVFVGLAGVLFIATPSGQSLHPMALVALLSAVFMSGELISVRFIAQRDPPTTTLFMTNLVGFLICSAIAPFVWTDPSAVQWGLMALVGVITASGQIFFIRAITMMDASFVAPLFYSTLVYAAAYGFFVFAEIPALSTVIGSTLIVGSGIFLGRMQTKAAQVKKN